MGAMSVGTGRHAGRARPARRLAKAGVILAVAVAALAGPAGLVWSALAHSCAVSAKLVPSCGAWWGMYVPVASDSELTGAVGSEERFLGRRLGIIERYHDMSAGPDGIFPDPAERQLARDHLLLFSWAPNVWSSGTWYPWRMVASGALDRSVIEPEARRLRAFGHTVFLTFAAEPDHVVPREGSPAQFVAAWRHVHGVFARLGVRNVVWVWTTEGYLPHAGTIAALYPGNSYVDWVGYDPYNYFTCHGAPWLSFSATVLPFYKWLISHNFGDKPIMLAEFSSAPDPRDPARAASWYRSVSTVARGLPDLKALIQWNATVPGCDLRLADGSAAGRAYRQAGLSPYFPRNVP
jgi:hypothetical protein